MPTAKTTEIDILKINRGRITFHVLGITPMICARMSEKAKHQLLMPSGRKTAAEKAGSLKHNPYEEFAASPYTLQDDKAPTYLACLATAFKQAMAGAAKDIPGSSRAQMGRLTWVEGERLPLYGKPEMLMSVTRSADMNKTPDIRTRCIVPEWAAEISVSFMQPILKDVVISNLLAAAGLIQGVGDWRPEKGSGTYGQFELVNPDDPEYVRRRKIGRKQQLHAMKDPQPYDLETEELAEWFDDEAKRRGHKLKAVS